MGERVLVYVAGASREHERVRKWANALSLADHIALTLTWWEGAEAWAGRDEVLPLHAQRPFAAKCEGAIRASRIFWMLWPETELTAGAFIELGYALSTRFHAGRHFDVIISGLTCTRSIFTASADYRSDSDALAFDQVLRFGRRHQAEPDPREMVP